MTDAVRIGILGTGAIAGRALLEPARAVPGAAVVAVGSRERERAASFAAEHGIDRAVTYDELLADPDVDVVYVTLPPSLHAEWSIRAMEAGRAATRTGRIFVEAFHYHHHPLAKRVRELVLDRAIGAVREVEATFHIPSSVVQPGNIRLDFGLGGGATMDCGCYPLHALRHLLGEPVRVVSAIATPDERDARVDVGMTAEVEFPDGVRARVGASFRGGERPDVLMTLRGTRGELRVSSLYVPQWGGALSGNRGGHEFTEAVDPTPSYVFQLRELVRTVRDAAPVLTNAADGVRTMRLVDDVYRAAGPPRAGSLQN